MEKFELTAQCSNEFCGAPLPEPLLAPAYCEDCEDDRLEDLALSTDFDMEAEFYG